LSQSNDEKQLGDHNWCSNPFGTKQKSGKEHPTWHPTWSASDLWIWMVSQDSRLFGIVNKSHVTGMFRGMANVHPLVTSIFFSFSWSNWAVLVCLVQHINGGMEYFEIIRWNEGVLLICE
jgi:hypothetical protein